MSALMERFEHDGMIVELHYDEDAQNPLTEWDLIPGEFVNWGMGEGELGIGGVRRLASHAFETDVVNDDDEIIGERTQSVTEYFTMDDPGALVIPLYYWGNNHGPGTATLERANDNPEDANTACVIPSGSGWSDHETAVKGVLSACEALMDYCNGHVYGYRVLNSRGEEVDSCWGIYGYEYVEAEAKRVAEEFGVERRFWARIWQLT